MDHKQEPCCTQLSIARLSCMYFFLYLCIQRRHGRITPKELLSLSTLFLRCRDFDACFHIQRPRRRFLGACSSVNVFVNWDGMLQETLPPHKHGDRRVFHGSTVLGSTTRPITSLRAFLVVAGQADKCDRNLGEIIQAAI